MSSSRDLISLIGVPGISLAIRTAWPTYSLRARRGGAEFSARRAPAEAAAEDRVVHVAFFDRQSGCLAGGGKRGFAVLRAGPDLALVRRVARGRVHRLPGGGVLGRIGVDRLDLLGRAGDRSLHVALLIADERVGGVETGLEHLGDRRARDLGV